MRLSKILIFLLIISMVLAACVGENNADTDDTAEYTEVVISEVMTGIEGNNLYDYIELYNPGNEPFDLHGYNLIYLLKDGDEEITIASWSTETLIPPHGHYLIGKSGQDFGILVDYEMAQSLVPTKGGVDLRFGVKSVDKIAWGSEPSSMRETEFAASVEQGQSLERLPGGSLGNGQDTDVNLDDFSVSSSPSPQNTGSALTPSFSKEISFTIEYPETAKPGEEFSYFLIVENKSGEKVEDLHIVFPHSYDLEIVSIGSGIKQDEDGFAWDIASLGANEKLSSEIVFVAPLTFMNIEVVNSYAKVGDWESASFAGLVETSIEGGSIPISTARELIGMEVVIEGTATMYTGGFYAGSGAKFYVEDETGGLQIYVSGAGDSLDVPIGAHVQVQGRIEPYRGALELIPLSENQVVILESPADWDDREPQKISIGDSVNDDSYVAEFVQVEGVVARSEELSYSYEMDLVDDEGQLVTLYVDKGTGISLESVESGELYQVSGIIEVLDNLQRIYPRQQSDLVKIFPPILAIEAEAPILVSSGESFEISFNVFNHTTETMTNILVTANLEGQNFDVETIGEGGSFANTYTITWIINELAGNGSMATVSLTGSVPIDTEMLKVTGYSAVSDQWEEPAAGNDHFTFFGSSVPIWAIQGSGKKTPYILQKVQTEGIVTGVFEDLEGFWIQEMIVDDDPNTSEGIFVSTGAAGINVELGDLVSISGVIREVYQETRLVPLGVSGVEVLSQGNGLPAAVEIDPPVDNEESRVYFETLEGMLVSISGDAIVSGPAGRYGEFSIILDYHGLDRVFQYEDTGMVIRVDDGTNYVHESQEKMDHALSQGDSVSGIVGPLAFTYGNYKIEPIEEYSVEIKTIELPMLDPLEENEFSIMSWNVENLFDFLDPHPTSPSMPTVGEYKDAIAKVANTIISAGAPTVIGFQEVENIGILEDIAEHELLADHGYEAVLIEGTDSRGIDVGYLVDTDYAMIIVEEQFPAPEGITSRPPLLVQVQIELENGTVELFVLNNHFTSMSGGEKATEPRRNAQSEWNVEVMEAILAENPGAYLSVIGDLNSYYDALPIDTLRDAGLIHVFDILDEGERYTYVYQGVSQVLDHILVTGDLMDLLVGVDILHTNADYVLPPLGDETLQHKSDHDPVIAKFALP